MHIFISIRKVFSARFWHPAQLTNWCTWRKSRFKIQKDPISSWTNRDKQLIITEKYNTIGNQAINLLWHIFNINILVINCLQVNFSWLEFLTDNQTLANYQQWPHSIWPKKSAKNDDILMSKYKMWHIFCTFELSTEKYGENITTNRTTDHDRAGRRG